MTATEAHPTRLVVTGASGDVGTALLRRRADREHGRARLRAPRRQPVSESAAGAFNLAAEPVLDARSLVDLLGRLWLPMPYRALRPLAHLTWRIGLQPRHEAWLHLAEHAPLVDTSRARDRPGWQPWASSHQRQGSFGPLEVQHVQQTEGSLV